MHKRTTHGFTLIELLLVVAIIGLLSSVVLASLNTARARARDAQRLSDMRSLESALELYRSDNPTYPSTSSAWWGTCSSCGSHGTSGASGYVPNLAPTYIPELPRDPKTAEPNRCYLYRSNGADYMIVAHYTPETYTPSNNPRPRPAYPNENFFAAYISGAAAW